jgi:hypothetical protein
MTPRPHSCWTAPLAAVLLAGGLCACAATPAALPAPAAGPGFGVTTRTALAQQIAHPDAAGLARGAAGVDGAAARNAQERYQKSYLEAPPPQGVFTIGVSGAK